MKTTTIINIDGEDMEFDKTLVDEMMDIANKRDKTFEEIFKRVLNLYIFTSYQKESLKESVYVDKKYQLAIYLNEDEKLCYSCDLNLDGTLNKESVGILVELNSVIIKNVNEFFKTDIADYGVEEVKDEVIYKSDTNSFFN